MDLNGLIQMIQVEYQKKDYDKALHFSRSLGNKLLEFQNAEAYYAICLFFEGRILVDQDQLEQAEPVLLKCQTIYLENQLKDDPNYLMVKLALGDLYFKKFDDDLAEMNYQEVEKSQIYGNELSLQTKLLHKYAVIAERRRKYDEAIVWYEKYLDTYAQLHHDQSSIYVEYYTHKEKLKLALEAKRANYEGPFMDPPGFISGTFEKGGGTLMDLTYAIYLVSELPNPHNADVLNLINQADSLQIKSNQKTIQVEFNEELKIKWVEMLTIEEKDAGHLMKLGDKVIVFFRDVTEELGRIEYFDEGYIRIVDKWKPDAKLVHPEIFQKHLKNLGID
jgi:tetratricopeptide (TPR) repeat protein